MTERYLHKDNRLDDLKLKLSQQDDLIYAYENEISRLKYHKTKSPKKGNVYFEPKFSDIKESNSKYNTGSISCSFGTSFADNKKQSIVSNGNTLIVEELGKRIQKLENGFKATKKGRRKSRRTASFCKNGKRMKTKKIEFSGKFGDDKENISDLCNLDTPNNGNPIKIFSKELKRFDQKIKKMKNYLT